MNKIVLLPLDERPCNYDFPDMLFNSNEMSVIRPLILGDKKKPADAGQITEFLKKNSTDADYMIISMDMLLYGGLIPSRLHALKAEEVDGRLKLLRTLKEENPKLKIYAFQCIMRCPQYSSSDEEPDYYEECGAEIHKIGVLEHRKRLGAEKEAEFGPLYGAVKKEYLEDYLNRRKFNLEFNIKTLKYVKEHVIDFLLLPQDDSAEYGFTAMDQETVYKEMAAELLQDRVYMYPGADEIALTLLSKVTNELHQRTPGVYIKYASVKAPFLIPAYEDRPLGETLKYHIMAAGCRETASEAEADFILAVTAPGSDMQEAANQPVRSMNYRAERNLTELVYWIEEVMKRGKPVAIGDNAYANGADLELIGLLNKRNLLMQLAGYAGWNTSSNTIGTAIAQAVQYLYCKNTGKHKDFLALRYIEDAGYCSVVRSYMKKYELEALHMNNFDVKEEQGIVSRRVHELLREFAAEYLQSEAEHIEIRSVRMPWKRMFETGLKVSYQE